MTYFICSFSIDLQFTIIIIAMVIITPVAGPIMWYLSRMVRLPNYLHNKVVIITITITALKNCNYSITITITC